MTWPSVSTQVRAPEDAGTIEAIGSEHGRHPFKHDRRRLSPTRTITGRATRSTTPSGATTYAGCARGFFGRCGRSNLVLASPPRSIPLGMTRQRERGVVAGGEGGRALLARRWLSVVECTSGAKPDATGQLQQAHALYGSAIDRVGRDWATDDRGAVRATRGCELDVPYSRKRRQGGSTLLPENQVVNPTSLSL
jgi:hypothetical protein